ncbi:Leucine-rich repeat domain superfamily [Sesbania bispinosa]|nr:Leucine-rich repeat domain superfamily [Sesbania bispinosa]
MISSNKVYERACAAFQFESGYYPLLVFIKVRYYLSLLKSQPFCLHHGIVFEGSGDNAKRHHSKDIAKAWCHRNCDECTSSVSSLVEHMQGPSHVALLKVFKFNVKGNKGIEFERDDEAFVIAKTMSQLRHLQLWGNMLTNNGLLAILDGCPHLESLDLRACFNLDLNGSLGESGSGYYC